MALNGKTILLCVSGGIAAFKAAALTSQLAQQGADVNVLLTRNAARFVTPLTFQSLSGNPVYEDVFTESDSHGIAHIDLADKADLIIVAPATANIIGKMAGGLADDMVTTTILASKAPVWIAPAMNVNMYEHPTVQNNMQILSRFGYRFLEAGDGLLACGWLGKGRLAEPEDILEAVRSFFRHSPVLPLQGKKVMVTAGPTQEKVDPVRYFSNHSSGKMGFALANAAADLGAEVTLVSGPTELPALTGVTEIDVTTAQEMYTEVMNHFSDSDIVIKAAAVSDYRPKYTSEQKQKKQPDNWFLDMVRTNDILATLGEQKDGQLLVGFAAESENIVANAKEKLKKKNLDMVVANAIVGEESGFRGDTNKVTIVKGDGGQRSLSSMTKSQIAAVILDEIVALSGGKADDGSQGDR